MAKSAGVKLMYHSTLSSVKTVNGVTKSVQFVFGGDTYEFEGKYFCVPNDSDAFLKIKYGDYMVLPKPENRHWHAKKIEV